MNADHADARPDPDALLEQADRVSASRRRGQLKIFLGAAPGVGKTYEMLAEARALADAGTNVLIGVVETHGREETARLVRGIPALGLTRIRYRGRQFEELDLDGILAAGPDLALIDELAHSNIPGSRHDKRWQDIEELREAGIDVFTTLNVQHLASLNDVVARISRIRVRETVPDRVLEQADQIEVVDLPPDELIQRLHAGKVYVPEQAARAVEHFFSPGNLAALREIALRAAAERVDADVRTHLRTRAEGHVWSAHERLLVVVGDGREADVLVRLGKRLAERRLASWIVAHVKRGTAISGESRATREALRLAETLGAQIATITGFDLVDEIKAYARAHNVTEILVGRSTRRLRWLAFRRSLGSALMREADEFVVTLAAADRTATKAGRILPRLTAPTLWPSRIDLLYVAIASAVAGTVAWPLSFVLETGALSMVFMCAVLVVAVRRGIAAAIVTSLTSFLMFNFLFTAPEYTFTVYQRRDVLTLLSFLIVSLLAGNQAARVRDQMALIRGSEERNARLYDFSRRIAGAVGVDDLAWAITEYLDAAFDGDSVVLYPSAEDRLAHVAGHAGSEGLIDLDYTTARWARDHNEAAGRGTGTLPNCRWYFLPMRGSDSVLGVIGITFADRNRRLGVEEQRLLHAVRDQSAVALSRITLGAEIESAQFAQETARLRATLLSAVSHDLRTPLASILGSAALVRDRHDELSALDRQELLDGVVEQTGRLDRFVQNLLDMTRLGYGALRPEIRVCDIREEVEAAHASLGVARRPINYALATDARALRADPLLFRRVLANLIENAIKYAGPDCEITVTSRACGAQLMLRVIDNGPGVAAVERDRIFDLFYRVRNADQDARGSGLGLSICKELVELMNGSIRAVAPSDQRGTVIEMMWPAV
ncbi:sensor histidine kinase KdpD [Salinisphaera sp. T31B1]|uniref:sensor histidine kinase KdpD n=1 Tax=Salinisphaera sp. T31B1 TaxID=727963 RepID=UPI003341129B